MVNSVGQTIIPISIMHGELYELIILNFIVFICKIVKTDA